AAGGRSLVDLDGAILGTSIRFCDGAKIHSYGCEISDIGAFASRLSTITGATGFAARGLCSTAHPDGSPRPEPDHCLTGVNAERDEWRAEGKWGQYVGGVASQLGKYISRATSA